MDAWKFFMLVSFIYGARACSDKAAPIMQVAFLALSLLFLVFFN